MLKVPDPPVARILVNSVLNITEDEVQDGGAITVIDKVRGVLIPQALLAVTLNVPELVGLRVTDVPEPLGLPPPEYDQV